MTAQRRTTGEEPQTGQPRTRQPPATHRRRIPPPDLRLGGAAAAAWLTAFGCLGGSASTAVLVAVVTGCCAAACLAIPARWTTGAALALVGAAAAAACTAPRLVVRDSGPLARLAAARADATLWLRVTDDPRPVHSPRPGPPSVAISARALRVAADGHTYAVGGRVLVLASGSGWPNLLPSQSLRAQGRLEPPLGADLTAAVLSARGPPVAVGSPSLLQRAAGRLRRGLRTACAPLPAAERGLLPGLVVGDTSQMDPGLADDFRNTGLTHLVAVSGTNCAVICGAVLFVLSRVGAGPRASAIVAGGALAGFVVLARPSPSVLRAAVMGALALAALVSGRARATLPALLVSIFGLVLVDPALARSAGFALSVLATGGLVLLAPGWRDALRRRLPAGVAEAIAVPAAAQAACAPLIGALFGQVSLVSVPANLLVVPAVAPATVLGVGAAVLSPVWAGGSVLLARLAAVPTWWLVEVARHGAAVPDGTVPWPGGVTGGVVLAGGLLVVGLLVKVRAVRHSLVAVGVAVAATAVPIRTFAPGWPPRDWVMVVCDVGQGDAIALHAAAGTAVVVDTGPDPVPVDRCLRRLGVSRIPLLVLTHFHADHVGGLIGALSHRRVGEIEIGPLREPPGGWLDVLRDARGAHVPLVAARVGLVQQVGILRIETLAPAQSWHGTHSDPNNSSIVLRVTVRGRSLLLPGDTEIEAQRALVAERAPLRVDILKVPHHGSRYQDARFLAATGAALAVVSVGANNDYGHPSARTLAVLRRDGARVLRTDRDGDVAVCVDDGGRLRVATRGVDRLAGTRRTTAGARSPPVTLRGPAAEAVAGRLGTFGWPGRAVRRPHDPVPAEEVQVLLELRGVSRRYGERVALAPIDMSLDGGRCLALLGPNGSGKSTLLRIAAGRDVPTSGQVRLAGAVLDEDDPGVRAKVAVVADAGAFYPDLTVREHLQLVALAHGLGDDAPDVVEQTLETMRLAGHADALPTTLSSGQQQAMLLAAALVRPRMLMVLDEPEQRLDPDARQRLADLLVTERSRGRAIVLATHHVELARSVADEVILLDEGAVLRRGRPKQVLA